MTSEMSEAIMDTLFYFGIFAIVIAFIFLHLSFPVKLLGNIIKDPGYAEEHDVSASISLMNQWGYITFFDGTIMIIGLVTLVSLRFLWKRSIHKD